jgi:hypothetical protein
MYLVGTTPWCARALAATPATRPESARDFGSKRRIEMSKIVCATAGTFLFALGLSGARAAEPGFCRDYTDAALHQVRAALATPACERGLGGARWSADRRVHYEWCLGASPQAVNAERAIRAEHLRTCRGM